MFLKDSKQNFPNVSLKLIGILGLLSAFFFSNSQNQAKSSTETTEINKIEAIFERIYAEKDTVSYRNGLDSIKENIKNIGSDSIRFYYEMATLSYRADFEKDKGNIFEAERLFQQYAANISLNNDAALNDFSYEVFLWLGGIYKTQGKFAEAIESYKSSAFFHQDPIWAKASSSKLIGDIYFVQRQFPKAYQNYRISAALFLTAFKKASPRNKTKTAQRLARCYEGIAEYHRQLGNRDSSAFYLNLRRPLLAFALPVALIDSYLLDALQCSETQQYANANFNFQKALLLAKQNFRKQKIAEIYTKRAELFLKQEKFESCIADADSAFNSIATNGNVVYKRDFASLLAIKSKAILFQARKLGDKRKILNEVYVLLGRCINQLDSLAIENDADKQSLYALQHDAFSNAIFTAKSLFEATKDQQYVRQAFIWSDHSRSVALRNATQLKKIVNFAGVPDSVLQIEKSQAALIANLENLVRLSSSDNEINQIALNLQKQRMKQRTFLDHIALKYPEYYRLQHQIEKVNPDIIQQELKSGCSLLEYFVAEDSLYIFLLNKNEAIKLVSSPISSAKLQPLIQKTLNFSKGNDNDKLAYQKNAEALFDYLLQPVSQWLNPELIIVPDAELCNLPFEVLLSEKSSDHRGLHQLPFLIQKYILSYQYAAVLAQNPSKTSQRSGSGIYSPNFEDDSLFYQQAQLDFLKKNLPNPVIYAGKEATKGNFTRQSGKYQLLHLSSHGYANDSIGELSYIRFNEKERLYASELYALQLHADLVVLSACETATGEIRSGESAVGLTLGFLYAGAKSVLGSLWNVNQKSTNEFISAFYTKLKSGRSTAEALRESKLELISQNPAYAHPKYWAPFILVGSTIDYPSLEKPLWLQLVVGFSIISILIFIFIKAYNSYLYRNL
ncbi:MAG: CHAT domain-containing protein [Saprospiraceae bacterium]